MPVSSTSMRSRASGAARSRTETRPPEGVYLIALSSRFASTCSSARRSARARPSQDDCTSAVSSPARRRGSRSRSSRRASSAASTGSMRSGALPPSMRESSSRSSIRASSRRALARITSIDCTARGSAGGASASRSAKPRIAVSGVFSSCDALATKSRRIASTRRSSVTSWKTATAPGRPPGCAKGATCSRTRLAATGPIAASRTCDSPLCSAARSASTTSVWRTVSSSGRPSGGPGAPKSSRRPGLARRTRSSASTARTASSIAVSTASSLARCASLSRSRCVSASAIWFCAAATPRSAPPHVPGSRASRSPAASRSACRRTASSGRRALRRPIQAAAATTAASPSHSKPSTRRA